MGSDVISKAPFKFARQASKAFAEISVPSNFFGLGSPQAMARSISKVPDPQHGS